MAITAADLLFYASANRPLDDESTVGGAIDLKTRLFTTTVFNDLIEVVSSSVADVQGITIYGRYPNGRRAVTYFTLNGTTVVRDPGLKVFDTILDIQLDSDAVGTVTVRKSSTDVTFVQIAAGTRGYTSLFKYAFAYQSADEDVVRYDKFFIKNVSAVDSLLTAATYIFSDETSSLEISTDAAVNGNTSALTRLTAPAGITFLTAEEFKAVPGTNLAPTQAIGVWLKQTLTRNQLPSDSDVEIGIAGTSV